MQACELPVISGTFFRIVYAEHATDSLQGARSPEGRFHHDGEPALYMSSRPDWALKAVEAYLRPGDPPRVTVPLALGPARIVDLGDAALCDRLGIDAAHAAIPWQPQRARGEAPHTWRPADASRRAGADGMIYTARSAPDRWHLVLFRWNCAGGPAVAVSGPSRPLFV